MNRQQIHRETAKEPAVSYLARGETTTGQALAEARSRDQSDRQRWVRVLSRWVTLGHGMEVVGVYLTALGLAVLLADLVFGGFQIVQSTMVNAGLEAGQPGSVPFLPIGQVTGWLWLAGLPLWVVGSGLRRSAAFRLNYHASQGEPARPLGSRFAPPCPLMSRFGG